MSLERLRCTCMCATSTMSIHILRIFSSEVIIVFKLLRHTRINEVLIYIQCIYKTGNHRQTSHIFRGFLVCAQLTTFSLPFGNNISIMHQITITEKVFNKINEIVCKYLRCLFKHLHNTYQEVGLW